jgi:hypothetical protein
LFCSPHIRIVRHPLDQAGGTFRCVRLREETQAAADFYASLGFSPTPDETATHVLHVRSKPDLIPERSARNVFVLEPAARGRPNSVVSMIRCPKPVVAR